MKAKAISHRKLKMLDARAAMVELCGGTLANGQRFYAYITVYPSRYEQYRHAFGNGASVNLLEFGTVLKCGLGDEPPESVKREMENKHGLSHEFEEDLREALKKAGQGE